MSGRIYIDQRLSSYETLMQYPAGATLLDAARGTPIEPAVHDLAGAWRMTDYARVMPFVLATSIPAVVASAIRATSENVPEMVLRGIMDRMGNVIMPRRVRARLELVVRGLHQQAKEVRQALSETWPFKFQAEEAWEGLLKEKAFCLGLAASESQAYTGLYFAYENFLARVVEQTTGKWPAQTWAIGEGIKAQLGEDTWNQCWGDRAVRAARHARDALAHRGGRVNGETASFGELLHVEADHIRIPARLTRDLYSTLFARVLLVVDVYKRTLLVTA